jgi:hypothetical protein
VGAEQVAAVAYRLTPADQVWNRAAEGGPPDPGPGDRALTDLLRAHGRIMNSGVYSLFDTHDAEEVESAKSGYRFFGLFAVAELIDRANATPNQMRASQEAVVDREYLGLIGGSDAALGKCFEAHHARHPEAYRPVS